MRLNRSGGDDENLDRREQLMLHRTLGEASNPQVVG